MKYIFFGTPRFAEIVLKGLIDADMPPVAIVCNPDRPIGRKHVITPPPTKILAIAGSPDIDIIQPEKIDEIFLARLRVLEPDFFVVAAYAKILPRAVLDIPRLGSIGVHPSLLPRFRGASPIQSAILGGELSTGVTLYLMDEKMDHGPIVTQEPLASATATETPIYELSYLELEEKLAELGGQLLVRIIPDFVVGKTASPRVQDESLATFTKKFTIQDGFVEPEDLIVATGGHAAAKKAHEILMKINALNPEPGAWTMQDGKRIKLLAAEIHDGRLALTETQKEGEKPKRVIQAS
jgi:methionyl-tRNA formyltransferase